MSASKVSLIAASLLILAFANGARLNHPDMISWSENDENIPSNFQVFENEEDSEPGFEPQLRPIRNCWDPSRFLPPVDKKELLNDIHDATAVLRSLVSFEEGYEGNFVLGHYNENFEDNFEDNLDQNFLNNVQLQKRVQKALNTLVLADAHDLLVENDEFVAQCRSIGHIISKTVAALRKPVHTFHDEEQNEGQNDDIPEYKALQTIGRITSIVSILENDAQSKGKSFDEFVGKNAIIKTHIKKAAQKIILASDLGLLHENRIRDSGISPIIKSSLGIIVHAAEINDLLEETLIGPEFSNFFDILNKITQIDRVAEEMIDIGFLADEYINLADVEVDYRDDGDDGDDSNVVQSEESLMGWVGDVLNPSNWFKKDTKDTKDSDEKVINEVSVEKKTGKLKKPTQKDFKKRKLY